MEARLKDSVVVFSHDQLMRRALAFPTEAAPLQTALHQLHHTGARGRDFEDDPTGEVFTIRLSSGPLHGHSPSLTPWLQCMLCKQPPDASLASFGMRQEFLYEQQQQRDEQSRGRRESTSMYRSPNKSSNDEGA